MRSWVRYRADGIDGHRAAVAAEVTMEHTTTRRHRCAPTSRSDSGEPPIRCARAVTTTVTTIAVIIAGIIAVSIGVIAVSTAVDTSQALANTGGELSPDRIETWVATEPGGGIAPVGPNCGPWKLLIRNEDSPAYDTVLDSRVHPDGIVARLHHRRCDSRYQFAWIRDETPESLASTVLSELSDQRSRALPTPKLRLSPARLAVVNLETWLAVAEIGEISISAAVPGLSMTVAAYVESTVFDITTASGTTESSTITIECAGTGVIWERSMTNDIEHCGHTFLVAPDGPAVVSASMIWAGRWRSSTGASGDLGTIRGRASQTSLPVVEIVTVGRR